MTFKEALDNFKSLYDEIRTTGAFSIRARLERDILRINYDLHIYYIAYRDGDTDLCTICENDMLEILATYSFSVDELPIDIINSGGGGGVVPIDGFLDWTGTIHDYRPYSTRTSVGTDLKLYSESANEIPNSNNSNSLSVNGRVTAGSNNSSYSNFGFQGISYSGTGMIGKSTTSIGLYGYSVSGTGAFIWSDSYRAIDAITTTGRVAVFSTSGNALVTDKTSNLIETFSNEVAGIYNVSGTIHYTQDNPTISGTNTKVYFSYECGSTIRTQAYPRVPDVEGNKAYLWDTETNISSANHTEIKNHGTTIGTITATGTKEMPLGQKIIWRTTTGVNTIGDVCLMADINGFYIEIWDGSTWISKWDITF